MPLFNRPTVAVTVAEVQIVPANPTRKRLYITQTSANAVRVGPTGVLATTGHRLGQNQQLVIEGSPGNPCPTEAIFGIREGGADGSVSILEQADS